MRHSSFSSIVFPIRYSYLSPSIPFRAQSIRAVQVKVACSETSTSRDTDVLGVVVDAHVLSVSLLACPGKKGAPTVYGRGEEAKEIYARHAVYTQGCGVSV